MRSKVFIVVITFFMFNVLLSQNDDICEEKVDIVEELNTIDKCLIGKPLKSNKDKITVANRMQKQLRIKVSSKSRARYRRKKVKKIKRSVKSVLNVGKIENKIKSTYVPNEILFALVDELPRFENCNDNTVSCFNEELRNHFLNSFMYPEEAVKNKIEGKVFVRFIIDREGEIGDIKTFCSGNKKVLEDEIRRIIVNLPKFKPGKELGQNIDVVYSMPIEFKL